MSRMACSVGNALDITESNYTARWRTTGMCFSQAEAPVVVNVGLGLDGAAHSHVDHCVYSNWHRIQGQDLLAGEESIFGAVNSGVVRDTILEETKARI